MRIIPVLDLQQGQVVRGIAGRRHEYRLVESILCREPTPLTLARAFRTELGLAELYVADLDAIAGSPPAWGIYRVLLDDGFKLLIDAGVSSEDRADEFARLAESANGGLTVIVGLESLASPALLSSLLDRIDRRRAVFSLDLFGGVPRTGGPGWKGMSAVDVGQAAIRCGTQRMIVLDISRVGIGQGVGTEPVCRALKASHGGLELIGGGGIRSVADIQSLEQAGCDAALIASALHDGRIGRRDIESLHASSSGARFA